MFLLCFRTEIRRNCIEYKIVWITRKEEKVEEKQVCHLRAAQGSEKKGNCSVFLAPGATLLARGAGA
jgi:hypothetical protein